MFRELLRKCCTRELMAEVVGEAGDGQEAMRIIPLVRPNLLLLDLHLPNGDGFEVAEAAAKVIPEIRVLMLSSHLDDYTLYRVERSRTHGFVDKNNQTIRMLKEACETVMRGEKYFSPSFCAARKARGEQANNFLKLLSVQELEVLRLIGMSKSDAEISDILGIHATTAQTHRSHIMCKLQIHGSSKLTYFALTHGLPLLVTLASGGPVYD